MAFGVRVLFVAAGALNLSQRAFQKLPPTDGVSWVKRSDGIYAEKVAQGLAGSRAGISVGDKLIGIGFDGEKTEEITSPADVQMYLEAGGRRRQSHIFLSKAVLFFLRQLLLCRSRHIDPVPRWTPSIIFLVDRRHHLAWCRNLCPFQTRQPLAVCTAFRDRLPGGVCFSRLSARSGPDEISIWRSNFWTILRSRSLRRYFYIFVFDIRYGVLFSANSVGRRIVLYVPAAVFSVCPDLLSLIPQFFPEAGLTEAIARFERPNYDLSAGSTGSNFYHFVVGRLGRCRSCWSGGSLRTGRSWSASD